MAFQCGDKGMLELLANHDFSRIDVDSLTATVIVHCQKRKTE